MMVSLKHFLNIQELTTCNYPIDIIINIIIAIIEIYPCTLIMLPTSHVYIGLFQLIGVHPQGGVVINL